MSGISRRTFLSATGLTLAGVACGGGSSRPTSGRLSAILAGRRQEIQVIPIGTEVLPGAPERIAFGLIDPKARRPYDGGTGQLWIAPGLDADAIGPVPLRHLEGPDISERGVFVAEQTVPTEGVWFTLIELTPPGASAPLVGLESKLLVRTTTEMPKPGDRAVSVPTPTVRKPRGVDPICTRVPPCSMHETSLDAALDAGRPIVMTIGTPAFCQSQFCGPVVDVIESVKPDHPDVAFIHVEVLRDDEPETVQAFQGMRPEGYEGSPLAPAAIAWNLAEEPATYYIDGRGRIATRQLSAIDEVDVRAGLDSIA